MLHRAAIKSFRLRPASIQAGFPALQLRTYAKYSKPRQPIDYQLPTQASKAPRHGPEALRSQQSAPSASLGATAADPNSSDKSGKFDFSSLQEEFNSDRNGGDIKAQGLEGDKTKNIEFTESPNQQDQIQIPLHDLTKGIPSTLDAELAQSAKTDPNDLTSASSGGRGDGQMPASAYITSAERRRNRLYTLMFAGIALFVFTSPIYLGRNWETKEEEHKHPDAPSGWGLSLFYNRLKARLRDTLDYYNEPTFPKLLPNPDPVWERPYTLVLSLEDLLVHSEWSREHGWRMAKRPGVDYFLRYLSQYYEIVIFTSVASMNADPVIKKLDPYRIIMWPLYREATRYKNGEYIKDLSYLNRPLSKIILIDTDPSHAKLQPENAIILPKWQGSSTDNELVALIPFLEYVAAMQLDDTRSVLKSFAGKHIPTEFSLREIEARRLFQTQLDADRARKPKRAGIGRLGSALGIKSMPGEGGVLGDGLSAGEGFDQGKMLLDQIRERGTKQYEFLEKEIRENGAKWLKEMAADEEKANKEAMDGMKMGFMQFFRLKGKGEEKGDGEGTSAAA